MNYHKIFIALILMTTLPAHAVKPKPCDGLSKQCSKDVHTDKTIDGQAYSCYECKQTICKSGGYGPIAGTQTSSVCESKAPTGRALIQSQQELQFDEADAIMGKRAEVKGAHPKPSVNNIRKTRSTDHRKTKTVNQKTHKSTNDQKGNQIIAPNNRVSVDHRKKSGIKKIPKRGTKGPKLKPINAPTQVTLYDITSSQLTISWMDNSDKEYGVSVERGTPKEDRGGINYDWHHVFNVEERIDSNVKGTGWRTDGDDGLVSGVEYCYRLRAYHKKRYSTYSATACISTQ